MNIIRRNFPIGAEIVPDGVNFRVYAPICKVVNVCLEDGSQPQFFPLKEEGNGYFSATHASFQEGSLYRFQLDNNQNLYPDPASRYQPKGPFGPSQIIDPLKFSWTDQKWKGIKIESQCIYELHIGTFTKEGTLAAAMGELLELKTLGITVIELMPLNEFSGKFGWGYDGVNLFAPTHLYGDPEDVRRFVDAAHQLEIGVILDVVYNHFGPEGNFISSFSNDYFTKKNTDWGPAINFDHKESAQFFLTNIQYWIKEFHFDGLRFDATQSIFSSPPLRILKEMQQAARKATPEKEILIIAENESQLSQICRKEDEGGCGFDALWNDDFHHSAIVRLTGHREGYYLDYKGKVQEFISCIKHGFLYQGQYYAWQKKMRGTPSNGIKPASFVVFIQNHDQIANSGNGLRIHQLTDLGNFKAMTCLLLLMPGTPLLFQGQEFASSSPFFYFADPPSKQIAEAVEKGRKEFLAQFNNLATQEIQENLPDPCNLETFLKCKLDFAERKTNEPIYQLHKDLIHLRKTDPVLSLPNLNVDGAVLNEDSFVIRFFAPDKQDRLLIVNFGIDLSLEVAPEPLLAPVEGKKWQILWSSESLAYGGQGTPSIDETPVWRIFSHAACVYLPKEK